MAITLESAQAHLAAWLAADLALATASSYTITTGGGSRTLTRESGPEVRNNIVYWQRIVNELTAKSYGASNGLGSIAKWSR